MVERLAVVLRPGGLLVLVEAAETYVSKDDPCNASGSSTYASSIRLLVKRVELCVLGRLVSEKLMAIEIVSTRP